MDEPGFRNPFRSEADAFRLLVTVALGVLAVVVASELGGPWLGWPVAIVLVALATRASMRWLRIVLEPKQRP